MGLIFIGEGVFVDTDPVEFDIAEDPKAWDPEKDKPKKALPAGYNLYAIVEFSSLEHAYYGLAVFRGKPSKKNRPKDVEYIDRPMLWNERLAPIVDYSEALKLYGAETYLFEEYPFTQITSKSDYARLVKEGTDPKRWDPESKNLISGWQKPGVYDLRDRPPSYVSSVQDYELEEMKGGADETLEYMFQGEEWEELAKKLIEEFE